MMSLAFTCSQRAAVCCTLARPCLSLRPQLAARQRRLGCAAPVGRPAVVRTVAAGAARFGAGSAQAGASEDASRDFASSLALMVLGVRTSNSSKQHGNKDAQRQQDAPG